MATGLTKKQKEALTDKITDLIRNGPALRMSTDSSVNEMNINQISGVLNRIHYQAIGKELPTEISIPVKQLGSGAPSPDNIRPIVGYEIDGIGTIYDGELNVDTGVLTVSYYMVENNIPEGINVSGSYRYWRYPELTIPSVNTGADGIPDCYSNMYIGRRVVYPGNFYVTSNGMRVITVPVAELQNITSIDDAIEWCQAHPVEMLVPMADPLTYSLTPQQILQLLDQL